MPRSAKKSVAIPHPNLDGLKEQQKRRLFRYPSDNALIVGLIRYQLIIGKSHPITEEIARMHPEDQDTIDDFLLELNKRGLSLGGSFLEHVVERTVSEEKNPDTETIIRLQASKILELANRLRDGDSELWEELAS